MRHDVGRRIGRFTHHPPTVRSAHSDPSDVDGAPSFVHRPVVGRLRCEFGVSRARDDALRLVTLPYFMNGERRKVDDERTLHGARLTRNTGVARRADDFPRYCTGDGRDDAPLHHGALVGRALQVLLGHVDFNGKRGLRIGRHRRERNRPPSHPRGLVERMRVGWSRIADPTHRLGLHGLPHANAGGVVVRIRIRWTRIADPTRRLGLQWLPHADVGGVVVRMRVGRSRIADPRCVLGIKGWLHANLGGVVVRMRVGRSHVHQFTRVVIGRNHVASMVPLFHAQVGVGANLAGEWQLHDGRAGVEPQAVCDRVGLGIHFHFVHGVGRVAGFVDELLRHSCKLVVENKHDLLTPGCKLLGILALARDAEVGVKRHVVKCALFRQSHHRCCPVGMLPVAHYWVAFCV